MKKHNTSSVILTIVGTVLITCSVAITLLWYTSFDKAGKKAAETVTQLQSMMPTPYHTVPDDRDNKEMPSVQIDEDDFSGIISFPSVNRSLPICSRWNRETVNTSPCRFSGSIYSKDLIIGGSDNRGQLDFINDINMGDTVTVTDMTGGTYTYRITFVERTKDATRDNLMSFDGDLVIFARNTFALDYTVVRCTLDF